VSCGRNDTESSFSRYEASGGECELYRGRNTKKSSSLARFGRHSLSDQSQGKLAPAYEGGDSEISHRFKGLVASHDYYRSQQRTSRANLEGGL